MTALKDFVEFLPTNTNLVGHNIRSFDNRILLLHLQDNGLCSAMEAKVSSFMDTLPLFRELYPARRERKQSYKQEHLVKDILKLSYDAHNALGDVTSLKQLCENANIPETLMQKHTMTFSSTLEVIQHKSKSRERRSSLQPLVSNKVLTDGMAMKIASSGLCWDHLKLAYRRDGFEGLKSLLGEKTQFGIRVTKNKNVLEKLSTYLESL